MTRARIVYVTIPPRPTDKKEPRTHIIRTAAGRQPKNSAIPPQTPANHLSCERVSRGPLLMTLVSNVEGLTLMQTTRRCDISARRMVLTITDETRAVHLQPESTSQRNGGAGVL